MIKMPDNRIDIIVVRKPSNIISECPHCGEEINIDYDDFLDMVKHEDYEDWVDEVIKCPECGKKVEIANVDWD